MKKLSVFLILSTLNCFSQIPTVGLLGSWTFNGNANDVTGNNNNGTVVGASLTTDRFGNPNSAYNFNGSSNYIVMQSPGPTGSVSRSISFWAKSSSNSIMAAFDYGTIMVGGCFHILFNYNCQGVGFDVAGGIMIYGNTSLSDNNWHHYAAVYNSTISTQMNNVLIYVDGVAQTNMSCFVTSTVTNLNTGSADPITIGRTAGAATRYFNGQLDDYYFYNRALSHSEVLDLYNYSPCALPIAGALSGNTLVCMGTNNVYSIAPVPGATSYSWTLPNSWLGSSSSNSIMCVSGVNSGILSVVVSNSCGASMPSVLNLGASLSAPVLNASTGNPVICKGNTVSIACNGANTYTWQPGNLTGFLVNVSPSVTTTYTINGTSVAGCKGNTVFTQVVEICSGIYSETTNSSINIFPNPCNDQLTVTSDSDITIHIYSIDGKLQISKALPRGETNLILDALMAGIYIISVNTESGREFSRLIKQ